MSLRKKKEVFKEKYFADIFCDVMTIGIMYIIYNNLKRKIRNNDEMEKDEENGLIYVEIC